MSFFSRVLGGLFGSSNNHNKEEQTQQPSENNNNNNNNVGASVKQHQPEATPKAAPEAIENSNDETGKPRAQNKSKDEDFGNGKSRAKPRKRRSKDAKDAAPSPNPPTSPLPSSQAHPDTKPMPPSSALDTSAAPRKKFSNMFKRSKSPAEVKEIACPQIAIAVTPVQPLIPKETKPPNVKKPKAKKKSKAASAPGRRLRSSDDVFPEEFRNDGQKKPPKAYKNIKTNKSLPHQVLERSAQQQQESTVTESPSGKEAPAKKKKKKTKKSTRIRLSMANVKKEKLNVKEPKEGSAENNNNNNEVEVSVEQNAEMAATITDSASAEQKKREDAKVASTAAAVTDTTPDAPSLRSVILDREEVNRLIADLKQEDRDIPRVVHDPWLPLQELIARSNDIYSDKRARNNAAITYEKFIDYELCSSKENKDHGSGEPKKAVSIHPKIDREHFDVTTRANVGKDETEVIDHKPGQNHPDQL